MISLLTDILFPTRCAGCGMPVSSRQHNLCHSCALKIPFLENGCPVCAGPAVEDACPLCSGRHWYIDANITVAAYDGVMKRVLHELKFARIRGLHAVLGTLAADRLVSRGVSADLVTWVPMNAKKRWKRGFNQSELVARVVSGKTGIPARKLLVERRGMETQRTLGLRDRFINILDRYEAIAGNRVEGRSVLLVDDIFTTGATVNECARQLTNAGARSVISLTIARADIKRLEK